MSEVGAGRLTMQVFFSRYHLHVARLFRDRVLELESGSFSLAHRSNCLACIMSSASFLEALINEAFDSAATGFGGLAASLPEGSRTRLVDAWEFLDKPSSTTADRFNFFVRRCGGVVDKGAEPWQSMGLLFDLRNAIVHARPVDTTLKSPVEARLEKAFASRISRGSTTRYRLNRQFAGTPANPYFPDHLLGHGCCLWAVDSAEAFAAWFARETKLAPWWEPA